MNLNYPQRRVFRGQGGATDRRLPKHRARRRQTHELNSSDHHTEDTHQNPNPENIGLDGIGDEACGSLTIIHTGGGGDGDGERWTGLAREQQNQISRDICTADSSCNNNNEQQATADGDRSESHIDDNSHTARNPGEEEEEGPPPPYLAEIKHLKRRIRNVQELSIQASRDSIASDVTKYQDNVLNATQNCVNEWRSIARHYSKSNDDEGDETCLPASIRTEVGLIVFQLIQLSVQSGPLSGAKPGYFKRCGASVARVVLDFLEEVVPQHEALGIDCMGFSNKQLEAMRKWKVDAQKAVANNKPPSKSVLKKMQQQQQQQQPKKGKKKKKK